jgi:hypothetical protein
MITHGHGDKVFFQYLNELGPMILILVLGHFYACFITLKWSQLGSHEFCLSLNPKTHSSNKLRKEIFIV